MAAKELILLWDNLIARAATALSASSTADGRSPAWLADQLRSQAWRSATGWTIVAGFNDKIDITEGTTGDATATLTPGTYATGALMAAQIQTQLNVAATDNTWTCTYNSSVFKFVIGHDEVATGGLEWSTGANAATSAGLCLGYDVSADDTGSGSYTADNVSYQSRHWIKANMGSAIAAEDTVLLGHNLSGGETVTIQQHTADTWSAPDNEDSAWTSTADPYVNQASAVSKQWTRIVIEDVGNTDGYVEIGVWSQSPRESFTSGYANGLSRGRAGLATRGVALEGAHFLDSRAQRKNRPVRLVMATDAERTSFETMLDTVEKYYNFFVFYDGTASIDVLYASFSSDPDITHQETALGDRWKITLPLEEALA
jgi:hypothetical protein